MEAKFEMPTQVKDVKHPIAKVHHRSDKCLVIEAKEYKLILTEDMINLAWTIHRPNHDHNDKPYIVLKLPNGGRTVEYGECPTLSLHLKGRYPRIHHHGTFVYELDIITGEKKKCEWKDGEFRVCQER